MFESKEALSFVCSGLCLNCQFESIWRNTLARLARATLGDTTKFTIWIDHNVLNFMLIGLYMVIETGCRIVVELSRNLL
jgi:hypothetical protein